MPRPPSFEQDALDDKWLQHTVNLRWEQYRFLDELAQEMGVSVSNVARRVVTKFIDDLERD